MAATYPGCGVLNESCELIAISKLSFTPLFSGDSYAFCCLKHYPQYYVPNAVTAVAEDDDNEITTDNYMEMMTATNTLFPGNRYSLRSDTDTFSNNNNNNSPRSSLSNLTIEERRRLQQQAALQRFQATATTVPVVTATKNTTGTAKTTAATTTKTSATTTTTPFRSAVKNHSNSGYSKQLTIKPLIIV